MFYFCHVTGFRRADGVISEGIGLKFGDDSCHIVASGAVTHCIGGQTMIKKLQQKNNVKIGTASF